MVGPNYLIPSDGQGSFEDLNLRILSYSPELNTSVVVSQDGSTYYYDIHVTNEGPRFERLDITVKIPKVDDYQSGAVHWEGGTNKQFLEMLPGNSDEFRVWVTTPHHWEYWGNDLSVTLGSESGTSEKITLQKPPIAIIGVSLPDVITFEDVISFTGSRSLWNIKEYAWDFDDGNGEIATTASHSFGRSGSHLVTLTVRDENDLTASRSVLVDVENTDPIAVIRVQPLNRTVMVDEHFTLDASFSQDRDGEIVDYVWEFDVHGENFDGIAPIIEHRYSDPGSYVVTLYVTDNFGAISFATTTITVIPGPEEIDPSGDDEGEEVTSIDPVSYLPAVLVILVLLGGFIIIYRKKEFINDLIQEVGDQTGK